MVSDPNHMQNKKTALIIMRDMFLLELYKTIFKLKGFEVFGLLEEENVLKEIKSKHPNLIVLERVLSPKTSQQCAEMVNQYNIPILILTKKEEACNMEKDLKRGIYDHGDIMNDNITDIVRRGEDLMKKWSR